MVEIPKPAILVDLDEEGEDEKAVEGVKDGETLREDEWVEICLKQALGASLHKPTNEPFISADP